MIKKKSAKIKPSPKRKREMQQRLFLARIALMFIGMNLLHAEENSCAPNLPPFTYQNPSTPVLPVGVQILLPAQTFTCSGSVTMWGIAVNGSGSHDIHLQIWRPSSAETDNETRSFTLMGSTIFYIEPIPGISLFYLMPDERRALSVERGDVLGLYIEDANRTEDGFHVQYQENMTNSTIYAYAVDTAMDFIEPGSMLPSSVLLEAAPVLFVTIDTASIMTENSTPTMASTTPTITFESTTPTMEVTTPTTEGTIVESTTATIMMEDTTPTTEVATPTMEVATSTTEGPINMEETTPMITKTTTMHLQEGTTSPTLSVDDTTQTTPTHSVTTSTHRTAPTQRPATRTDTMATRTDTMATPTLTESISTTSEVELTDDTKITYQPTESDEEETTPPEERTSASPDESEPTMALVLVMMTSMVMLGIVGMSLVMTLMVVRAMRRRTHRGHGHRLPHKPISLPPPPMSPPPPPPQYEVKVHIKEKNLQAKFTSSLSSSLTTSLIWWLHGEKEQLRMLMAREYETPVVTKCHVTMLEASMHLYDTPIVASTQVVLLHSAHHYEDIP